MTGDVHVKPTQDLREHITDGSECWCNPRVVTIGRVGSHNSADGREHREPDHDPATCPTCKEQST